MPRPQEEDPVGIQMSSVRREVKPGMTVMNSPRKRTIQINGAKPSGSIPMPRPKGVASLKGGLVPTTVNGVTIVRRIGASESSAGGNNVLKGSGVMNQLGIDRSKFPNTTSLSFQEATDFRDLIIEIMKPIEDDAETASPESCVQSLAKSGQYAILFFLRDRLIQELAQGKSPISVTPKEINIVLEAMVCAEKLQAGGITPTMIALGVGAVIVLAVLL